MTFFFNFNQKLFSISIKYSLSTYGLPSSPFWTYIDSYLFIYIPVWIAQIFVLMSYYTKISGSFWHGGKCKDPLNVEWIKVSKCLRSRLIRKWLLVSSINKISNNNKNTLQVKRTGLLFWSQHRSSIGENSQSAHMHSIFSWSKLSISYIQVIFTVKLINMYK